jgi:hypothetical protein
MWKENLKARETIDIVKNIREVISPNSGNNLYNLL